MTNVTRTAASDFVHGPYTGRAGEPIEMPKGVADDLERAGLLHPDQADAGTKAAPAHENKMAPEPANKSGVRMSVPADTKAAKPSK